MILIDILPIKTSSNFFEFLLAYTITQTVIPTRLIHNMIVDNNPSWFVINPKSTIV